MSTEIINGEVENIMYAKRKDNENNTVWVFQYKNNDPEIIAFGNKMVEMKHAIEKNTNYKCAVGFNFTGIFVKTEYPDVLANVKIVLKFIEKLKQKFIEEQSKQLK